MKCNVYLSLSSNGQSQFLQCEMEFVKKDNYYFLKITPVKKFDKMLNNVEKNRHMKMYRTFSVSNYSNAAKLDLKLGEDGIFDDNIVSISFKRKDFMLDNNNNLGDLDQNQLTKETNKMTKLLRSQFTKYVLYAQIYNKAK